MQTINTFDEYKNLVKSQSLYVRYSAKIESGNVCSRNHQTGNFESGLSVNNTTVDFAANSDLWIAKQLVEYSYLKIGQKAICWLLTGDYVGRGADNEPLVSNVAAVAVVSDSVLAEASAVIGNERTGRIMAAIEKIRTGDRFWNPGNREMTNDQIINKVRLNLSGVWAEDVRKVLEG